jgi:hypothetical protein
VFEGVRRDRVPEVLAVDGENAIPEERPISNPSMAPDAAGLRSIADVPSYSAHQHVSGASGRAGCIIHQGDPHHRHDAVDP